MEIDMSTQAFNIEIGGRLPSGEIIEKHTHVGFIDVVLVTDAAPYFPYQVVHFATNSLQEKWLVKRECFSDYKLALDTYNTACVEL